jgi:putative inorganic carbon (HCO3(-)) transporter
VISAGARRGISRLSTLPRLASLLTSIGALLAALGVAWIILAGESPALPLLIVIALGAVIVAFATRRPESILLFYLFFTAPIDISKALVSPTSRIFIPDAPGLSISLMDMAFLGWAVLWFWQFKVVERRTLRFTRTDLAAILFLGWIWVRTAGTLSGMLGVATAIMYSKFVLVFLVISHAVRSPQQWRIVLRAGTAIFVLQMVYVVAQIASGSPLPLPGAKVPDFASVVSLGSEGIAFRPTGFFNHPNPLADYLVLILSIPLCLVLMGRQRIPERVWWIALGVLLTGVVVLARTFSRGGWVSLTFGFTICVLFYWRARILSAKNIGIGAIMVSITLVLAVVIYPGLLLRITGSDSRSTESRGLLTQQAAAIIRDHPLVGVGFASYNRAAYEYNPPGFSQISKQYRQALHRLVVHNHYLLLAAETGIPSVLLFFGIFFSMVVRAFRRVTWADPARAAITVGLAGGLLGNLLFLSSDNYYVDIRMSMLWLTAGLLQSQLLHYSAAERHAMASPFDSEAIVPAGSV